MSEDKVSILSNGQRHTGLKELESLNDLNITECRIEHLQVVIPTKDTAVFTYQAHQKGTWKGKTLPSHIMVSSVWANQNGKWLQVLYQETPVGIK